MDVSFTANMEKSLDEISNGKMTKIQVMGSFYKQLMEQITKVSGTKMDKITNRKVFSKPKPTIKYIFYSDHHRFASWVIWIRPC